ncbi:hypothetical protein BH24PSE2_BH24PSE2_08010 [soil metagenome]
MRNTYKRVEGLVFVLLFTAVIINFGGIRKAEAQAFTPDEFVWSYNGPVAGRTCVSVNEPSSPARHHWDDNYLCTRRDWQISWSYNGPIDGQICTQITEPSELAIRHWDDNFLCVPPEMPLVMIWSYRDAVDGLQCVQVDEPSAPGRLDWDDNYLCFERDTDQDGLFDSWETDGVDIDQDGVIDFDLPALGADPNHKTIIVEMDYFSCGATSTDCDPGHDDRPDPEAIELLERAFANAPLENPDGLTGINLIMLIDDRLPHSDPCRFDSSCFYALKRRFHGSSADRTGSASEATIRARRRARSFASHYTIWSHLIDAGGASVGGQALFGDILVSSYEQYGLLRLSAQNQAHVFMHELGHSLGLAHGGNDSKTCKPNYMSVMDPADRPGLLVREHYALDFSRGTYPSAGFLEEHALNERTGIEDGHAGSHYGNYDGDDLFYARIFADEPIDWNGNSRIDDDLVAAEIDHFAPFAGFCAGNSGLTRIEGFEDWSNLVFRRFALSGTSSFFFERPKGELAIEPTLDQIATVEKLIASKAPIPPPAPDKRRKLKIQQTYRADLDLPDSGVAADVDVWFRAKTATDRFLMPLNGTALALARSGDLCAAVDLNSIPIPLDDLRSGDRICIKTHPGNLYEATLLAPVGPSPGVLALAISLLNR